ncbi:arylsulfatase, partial [Acidobacteria bacterium AH-259-L09]|nr:arylsulfatase [Acidobacteria bacterium AH-259-L09]
MWHLMRLSIICMALVLLTRAETTELTARQRDSRKERPNIILILTDDQGYGDVGVHGNDKIRTPNLDRFAAQGIELTRFYCSPVCSPTRASLMTGRYYYRTGVIHTSRGGAKMHGEEVTIAELLARAGYQTGIFGKWHLGDNAPMRPQDQGFSESLVHKSGGIGQTPDKPNSYFSPILWHNGRRTNVPGYCTDVFFDAAIRFIEKNRDGPFFVYLPTNAPHAPLQVDPQYSQPYKAMGLDDTTAKVYGMISNIDENLGRLFARLDELKLRSRTVILFIGDNGPQQKRYSAGLRGRKSWVYEGGIRVPCFIQWPQHLPGRRKIDQIAAHIDVLPTLLDLCGIDKPHDLHLDGRSLLPLLRASGTELRERRLYFQCHRGLTPKQYQNCAVVTQRYKMIANPGTFSQENLDTAGEPVLELYDLLADPGEKNDLAARHPDILAKLQAAYDAWFNDVKITRGFTPGLIRLGTDAENPARLCRYQDANYKDGRPHGWTLEVVQPAQYEISIDRGKYTGKGRMYVRWLHKSMSQPLDAGENTAVFELPAGKGILDVWFQEDGKDRVTFSDNRTIGDLDVRRLD